MQLIIDGHLDIAMNALRYERDQRLPVADIRVRESKLTGSEPGTCTMTVEELRRSRVPVCVATVIARTRPAIAPERSAPRYGLDHPTQDMAYASAQGQLAYYEALQRLGALTVIGDRAALAAHWQRWLDADPAAPVGVIITMEGADPIIEPAELHLWYAQGLRTLMLAHFQQSCYAFGTPAPNSDEHGPLTDKGRALLKQMATLKMPLDLTHLCAESFAEAVDAYDGPVYSSHSNCRALADSPRQLTDEQLKLIVERGGVIGVALHNGMLMWSSGQSPARRQVGLDLVVRHIDHVCQVAGSAQHAAIGSDLDGGFGVEDCPHDLDTVADLHRLAGLLADRGYTDADVAAVLHGNWLRYWSQHLPEGGR